MESQLRVEAMERARILEGFRFCGTADCGVVYFGGSQGGVFTAADVKVPVFQKSDDPQRLVCYCFEHSVQGVREEVRRTGDSRVLEDIKEKCRAGLDRCPLTNPQGVCCLGNVLGVVKEAKANSSDAPAELVEQNCCAAEKQQTAPPAGPNDKARNSAKVAPPRSS